MPAAAPGAAVVGWVIPAAQDSQHQWGVLELQLVMGRPTLQAGGSLLAEMETERAGAAYPELTLPLVTWPPFCG